MKKSIFMFLMITLYLISGIRAYAEEYIKTIDYRYDFVVYTQGKYWASGLPEWRTGRETEFDDSNTDSLIFTQTDNQSNYTTLTLTSVLSASDGTMYFRSSKVAGGLTTPWLSNFYADYIYQYSDSTVDVNYTLTFTVSNNQGNRYNYIVVEVYGISRVDDSLVLKDTYTFNNNPQTGQYGFGTSCTYEGSDGFNYKGFVYRLHLQCITSSTYAIKCDSTEYNLYTFTNSLDTFTETIDYTDQLNNINGSLQSIYNAIVSAPTTIVNAIQSLPTTIATGIKHIFIYDNWEQDLRLMADDIEIPMISQLTYDTAVILDYFTSYTPKHDFDIKIPKLTRDSNSRLVFSGYMINIPFDLADVLNFEINGVTILDAIRIITSYGATIYIFLLMARFTYAAGIDVYDYLHPVVEQFIVESGVWGQEV